MVVYLSSATLIDVLCSTMNNVVKRQNNIVFVELV